MDERSAAGRRLYVYYRVATTAAPAAVAVVRAMQARLCAAHPGLEAELLWRPPEAEPAAAGADAAGGPTDGLAERTLMEVYRRPGGVDPALAQAIADAAAALPGAAGRAARHVEVFTPCD